MNFDMGGQLPPALVERWTEQKWRDLKRDVDTDVRSVIGPETIISDREVERLGSMIQCLSQGCDAAERMAKMRPGTVPAVALPTEMIRSMLTYAVLEITEIVIENYDRKERAAKQ